MELFCHGQFVSTVKNNNINELYKITKRANFRPYATEAFYESPRNNPIISYLTLPTM
jgi:hypothetical protein